MVTRRKATHLSLTPSPNSILTSTSPQATDRPPRFFAFPRSHATLPLFRPVASSFQITKPQTRQRSRVERADAVLLYTGGIYGCIGANTQLEPKSQREFNPFSPLLPFAPLFHSPTFTPPAPIAQFSLSSPQGSPSSGSSSKEQHCVYALACRVTTQL